MNILFVVTYYRPHWTGLTQYAGRLAEGLANRGHHVEVLCSLHQENLPEEEIVNGVKVFRVPTLGRISRTEIAPLFPLKLMQRIRSVTTVVAYLPLAEVGIVALLTNILKRKFFLVHNGDLVLPKGAWNRLLEKIYYATTGFAIGLSDGIVIQTEDYAEQSKLLANWKKKRKRILPLYKRNNTTSEDIDKFKKTANLKGRKLVGFSGRFVEEKGVDILLKAIPKVVARFPNTQFIFAGEYRIHYEKYWRKVAPLVEAEKRHITLPGLIRDQSSLNAFYGSLDVFVVPSRSDCFPSSQVEAALAGAPLVCTDIPGARWVVKQSGMGVIVEPNSPDGLAEGIMKLLKRKRRF